eukprot:GFYU01008344.1.p1 GENE.GFYU01008344.1~~GFYU01008344.1.p1  ORF type:complete len:300 (-),score=51.87 GFYU01008344.1:2033-2932(-)
MKSRSGSVTFYLLGIVAAVFVTLSQAKIFKGEIKQGKRIYWQYVDKFGYMENNDENPAFMRLKYKVPPGHSLSQYFILYDDRMIDWLGQYESSQEGCADHLTDDECSIQCVNKYSSENLAVQPLRLAQTTTDEWRVIEGQVRAAERPTFWYIAMVNCDISQNLDAGVEITFLNPGGQYTKHFSVEEHGLYELYIAFLPIAAIIAVMHYYGLIRHRGSNTVQITYLLTVSITLEWIHCMFQLAHRARYSNDGIGFPDAALASELFKVFQYISFVILVLLIAKGYTIRYGTSQCRCGLAAH